MKLPRKHLKKLASQTLINRYSTPVGAYILIELIASLLLMPFALFVSRQETSFAQSIYLLAIFIVSLISGLFSCGMLKLILSMVRNEPYEISDVFYCFNHHPDRYIIVSFFLKFPVFVFQIPYIFLITFSEKFQSISMLLLLQCSLFLLQTIVSLYISLHYGLSYFLLLDHPEMSPTETLKESRKLMIGNKKRLFYIYLSFIGMVVLGTLSFFIGFLWIVPYFLTTFTFFYLDITKQLPSYDVTV